MYMSDVESFDYQLGQIAGVLLIIALLVVVIYFIQRTKNKTKENSQREIEEADPNTKKESLTFQNSYEPRYLMTLNEKAQYKKIKQWAEGKGLIVFSKVRLLDLIAPRKNQNNYQALLWKIQAKHVDFVICDNEIRVKGIIEINDNSHKQSKRIERDIFVTQVLRDCGYRVLQSYDITEEQLETLCNYNQSNNQSEKQL